MIGGFRAFPGGFTCVVLDGTQKTPTVIRAETFKVPAGQSEARDLCWVRKQLSEILNKHSFDAARVKTTEPFSKRKSPERGRIEGVIAEAVFAFGRVEAGFYIKAQLKRAIPSFGQPARYLENFADSRAAFASLKTVELKEAAVAALSALPEG